MLRLINKFNLLLHTEINRYMLEILKNYFMI